MDGTCFTNLLLIGGHIGCFQFLALTDNVMEKNFVNFFLYSEQKNFGIPRSRFAKIIFLKKQGIYNVCSILPNLSPQRVCIILNSHQPSMRVPISPYSLSGVLPNFQKFSTSEKTKQ